MELKIKRNDVCSFLLILAKHTSKTETLSARFTLSMKTFVDLNLTSLRKKKWMRWFREIALTEHFCC